MPYPKALSQKSLEKQYNEAGLSVEVRGYLHKLFAACANLYGVIELIDVWKIHKQCAKAAPVFKLNDMIAFSSIVRREEQPYYVFELKEVYSGETNSDRKRLIVSKPLVGFGAYKFSSIYRLEENRKELPFYIPDDITSFAEPKPIREEKELIGFIGGLRSTADICTPKYGAPCRNVNKGKRLNQFSFLNARERFDLDYYKSKSQKEIILNDCRGTESEKLVRHYKYDLLIGRFSASNAMQYVFDELNMVGVILTNKQIRIISELLIGFNNHMHLWTNNGWSPQDAFKMFPMPADKTTIRFGSGIKQMFADGSLNKEDFLAEIHRLGFDTSDD